MHANIYKLEMLYIGGEDMLSGDVLCHGGWNLDI
jgi:hypothetical protein